MEFFNYITPNSLILTPNRRLAALITKNYSQWQITQNRTCWESIAVMPLYPSWLEKVWLEYSAQMIEESPLLLSSSQEYILWEKILRSSSAAQHLLHIAETVKLIQSAWETLRRWQVNLHDPALKLTEDSRLFVDWAHQFQNLCHKNNWIDQNSLANQIAEKIQKKLIPVPDVIFTIGFTEIAPQYRGLLNICQEHGATLHEVHLPNHNQTASCIGLSDTEKEISTMASWAKSMATDNKKIGCIIPSLSTLREKVIRIFLQIFDKNEINISAGKNLTLFPVIADALLFLNLSEKSLNFSTLTRLLHSPFLGEAEEEQLQRAQLEAHLRYSNIHALTITEWLAPKYNLSKNCPALAKRLSNLLTFFKKNATTRLGTSDWIQFFNQILSTLGWPGERSLNSHEYQVVKNAWFPLLNDFAALSPILGKITHAEALHYLINLTNETIFQPESPEANVQILGLLEAADIPFDYSWVMGLNDTQWPAKPKPNPFIPLRLQKMMKMPNASAERELQYCQELTKQLQQSSTHIIFSYPLQEKDTELRPSSLLKTLPHITTDSLSFSTIVDPVQNIFNAKKLDYFEDNEGPLLSEHEKISGGVRIFKTQAECAFKAFAELRLHAKNMEETSLGLRKTERGTIVHKALEFIWTHLKNSTTLQLQSDEELIKLIHECAVQGLQKIVGKNILQQRYYQLELKRLEKLLWNWLDLEKTRSPFQVVGLEQEIKTTIGKITTQFRIDRIDELLSTENNSHFLIIDYKTGKDIQKNNWFSERLMEPQLPLYLISTDKNVGIAFAQVNPNKMALLGISSHALTGFDLLADINQADATLWEEQKRIWKVNLEKLADDFFHGYAAVNPKDKKHCDRCALHSVCRIHELNLLEEEYDTI